MEDRKFAPMQAPKKAARYQAHRRTDRKTQQQRAPNVTQFEVAHCRRQCTGDLHWQPENSVLVQSRK
jgi:hypothetical protein